jgi:DNA-binding transcriptional ArsR family regulator
MLGWLSRAPSEPHFPGPGHSLLANPNIAVITQLLPSGSVGIVPDFLTPRAPSLAARKAVLAQLDQLAGSSPEIVFHQVHERFRRETIPSAIARRLDNGQLASTIASTLREVWKTDFSWRFDEVERHLQDDLSYRCEILARHGLGSAFDSLHPRFRWRSGMGFHYVTPTWTEKFSLKDTELVISPSVLFYGSTVTFQLGDPSQAVITYPTDLRVRDYKLADKSEVDALIGSSRSRILAAIKDACTTTTLSAALNLSPAAVSYHLGVLHRSGLARRIPRGRRVLYVLTPAGRALLPSVNGSD